MSQYVITNGRIYTEAQVIEKGILCRENGKISDIQKGDYKGHLNQIDVAGKACVYQVLSIFIFMVAMEKMRWMHRMTA